MPALAGVAGIDIRVANASVGLSGVVAALLQRYGKRLGYLLAVSGAYIDGARAALVGAGRQGDQPPLPMTPGCRHGRRRR